MSSAAAGNRPRLSRVSLYLAYSRSRRATLSPSGRVLREAAMMQQPRPVASQPGGGGGSELGWVEHQAHPPPLGHCPPDVINLKNAPTLGHSQAPPPLVIARVTSSTYSIGGTKLLKGGTKLLKGGTKLLKGGTKLLKGGTKLLKGGTKLLKGGTKSLGWATGGGRTTPPTPPPGYGPATAHIIKAARSSLLLVFRLCCARSPCTPV